MAPGTGRRVACRSQKRAPASRLPVLHIYGCPWLLRSFNEHQLAKYSWVEGMSRSAKYTQLPVTLRRVQRWHRAERKLCNKGNRHATSAKTGASAETLL